MCRKFEFKDRAFPMQMPIVLIVSFIIYLFNSCLGVRPYHSPIFRASLHRLVLPGLAAGEPFPSAGSSSLSVSYLLSRAPCLSSVPERKRKFGDSSELEISVFGAVLDLRGTGMASQMAPTDSGQDDLRRKGGNDHRPTKRGELLAEQEEISE